MTRNTRTPAIEPQPLRFSAQEQAVVYEARQILLRHLNQNPVLSSWQSVLDYCALTIRGDVERFHALYLAALHEMGHATGHASRLGRDFSGAFGTKKYAFEELIAEISSAFCCASLGIVPTVRHADYIGSWLEVMREDSRAIVRAASQASKAADWLLAHLPDAGTDVERQTPTEGRTAA